MKAITNAYSAFTWTAFSPFPWISLSSPPEFWSLVMWLKIAEEQISWTPPHVQNVEASGADTWSFIKSSHNKLGCTYQALTDAALVCNSLCEYGKTTEDINGGKEQNENTYLWLIYINNLISFTYIRSLVCPWHKCTVWWGETIISQTCAMRLKGAKGKKLEYAIKKSAEKRNPISFGILPSQELMQLKVWKSCSFHESVIGLLKISCNWPWQHTRTPLSSCHVWHVKDLEAY